jgi:hypothetical protein
MIKEFILKWIFNLDKKEKYVKLINDNIDLPLLSEEEEQTLIDFIYNVIRALLLKEKYNAKKIFISLAISLVVDILIRNKDVLIEKLNTITNTEELNTALTEVMEKDDR